MSLAIVKTRARVGINAPLVTVEIHLSGGLPSLSIVGMPETAVKESKDRVRSALMHAGFEFPMRRITINLAPADLPKEGSRFDLPIALGILAASGQIPPESLESCEFLGELALDGGLRAIRGALPALMASRQDGRSLLLPAANAAEAALASRGDAFAASSLSEVCAHLWQRQLLQPILPSHAEVLPANLPDLSDVRGQRVPKRALEVAAAGGHNLLFFGPPGTGKSMLASRLPSLLPQLEDEAALAVASVHSVAGQTIDPARWRQPPFRAPHHTASAIALVGGGSSPRPGEISLAHHGVLFLDELPEFDRRVLEVLREPMESGEIVISRATAQVRFPARFQMVAAMNPCPCGFAGHPSIACTCSPLQVSRYQSKLSGPLLDRFDLHIDVPVQRGGLLLAPQVAEETSAQVLARVQAARQHQQQRGALNAQLQGAALEQACQLPAGGSALLETAMEKLGLSARGLHRILRVARTLADLAGEDRLGLQHLTEALGYRKLDLGKATR